MKSRQGFHIHLLSSAILGLSLNLQFCNSGHHHMTSSHSLHNKYQHLPAALREKNKMTPDKAELKFRFSARNLPKSDRFGKSDPFLSITYLDDKVNGETKLGETAIIQDNSDPQWGDVFTFQYNRENKQKLHIIIYDKDPGRDDKVGEAYIGLDNYLANNENLQVDLSNGGFLMIEKA